LNSSGERLSAHNLTLLGWIGLIFFSSTGVAGRWANALYAMLSSGVGLGGGWEMLLFQKAYHVFLFGVLGALIVSAARRPALSRAILWSLLIGGLSEALQLFFAGRGPSFADVLLNGLSGSAGGWIWLRTLASRQKAAPRTVS
jgi:VanZ family protein